MGEKQESPEYKERKEKIMELFTRLKNDYGVSVKAIHEEIKDTKKIGYDALIDYSNGNIPKRKPKFVNGIIKDLENIASREEAKKMEKERNSGGQYKNPSENTSVFQEPIPGYKLLQCLYRNIKMDPEPYTGEFVEIGVPLMVKGIAAIIAEPNDSKKFKDAEGVVPSRDPASLGCDVAIKRIDINNCAWGRVYYIFDIFNQAYLVKLLQDTTREKFYRLVYKDPENYPEKQLHEDEILFVFRVIGTFIPE
jgi:hypothetical protein